MRHAHLLIATLTVASLATTAAAQAGRPQRTPAQPPAAAEANAPQPGPHHMGGMHDGDDMRGPMGGPGRGMMRGRMRGPDMMGGPEGMMGPGGMRGPGGSPAAMLVRMKGPLGLTDDQVKRLEALAAQQRTSLEPNVGARLRAQADLADARKGDGDLAATRKALEKLAQLRIDGMMAHLKAAQDARAILTPEQRERVPAPGGGMRGPGGMRR